MSNKKQSLYRFFTPTIEAHTISVKIKCFNFPPYNTHYKVSSSSLSSSEHMVLSWGTYHTSPL